MFFFAMCQICFLKILQRFDFRFMLLWYLFHTAPKSFTSSIRCKTALWMHTSPVLWSYEDHSLRGCVDVEQVPVRGRKFAVEEFLMVCESCFFSVMNQYACWWSSFVTNTRKHQLGHDVIKQKLKSLMFSPARPQQRFPRMWHVQAQWRETSICARRHDCAAEARRSLWPRWTNYFRQKFVVNVSVLSTHKRLYLKSLISVIFGPELEKS